MGRRTASPVSAWLAIPELASAMKFVLPEHAFPQLTLTPETERAIIELTDQRIEETIQQRESFREHNYDISRREWKLVHTNEGLNAYRRRREKHSQSFASSLRHRMQSDTVAMLDESCGPPSSKWLPSASRSRETEFGCKRINSCCVSFESESEDELDEATASPDAVSLLLTGILGGNVEDFALGSLAATESMTRQRHLHVDDEFEDVRVLATILAPTEGDPFRYLGVKWAVKDFGAFVKRRDFVFVEATGITTDAHGQSMSYQLTHSIELPQAPDLSQFGFIRGEVSTCVLAAEHDMANIEIYGRGIAEAHGKVTNSHAASRYALAVASVAEIVDCAYSKKALWVMRQPYACRLTPASLQDCQLCCKRFNVIEKITHASVACQMCRQTVCKRCSVDKKITVDGASDVVSKTFSFCVQCFLEAKDLPAAKVAIASLRSNERCYKQQSSSREDVVAMKLSKSPVSQLHPHEKVKVVAH